MKKVFAIASSGGHWSELMLLKEALSNYSVEYISTKTSSCNMKALHSTQVVLDAHLFNVYSIFVCALQQILLFLRFRPDIVITTGAGPGVICVLLGKIFRCKTIWIDSIANYDQVSMSCRMVHRWVDIALTQWPHLENNTIKYSGRVI